MEKLLDILHLLAFVAFVILAVILILIHTDALTMSASAVSVYKAGCIVTGAITLMMLI